MDYKVQRLSNVDLDIVASVLAEVFYLSHQTNSEFVINVSRYFEGNYKYFWEIASAHLSRGNPILGVIEDDSVIGVALVRLPDNANKKIRSLLLILKLWFYYGTKFIVETKNYSNRIRKHFPKIPFMYIHFIGVHPKYSMSGAGIVLLNEIHNMSENHPFSQGVAIETSKKENVEYYSRIGYQSIGTDIFNGKEVNIMLRRNKNHRHSNDTTHNK